MRNRAKKVVIGKDACLEVFAPEDVRSVRSGRGKKKAVIIPKEGDLETFFPEEVGVKRRKPHLHVATPTIEHVRDEGPQPQHSCSQPSAPPTTVTAPPTAQMPDWNSLDHSPFADLMVSSYTPPLPTFFVDSSVFRGMAHMSARNTCLHGRLRPLLGRPRPHTRR